MSKRNRAKSKNAAKVAAAAVPPVGWSWQCLALAVLAAAGIAVYWNSFSAAFIFDGIHFIRDNEAIRRLWPFELDLGKNRPLGFYTFALNYAVGGTNVWGYHAVNLAIHVVAACLLFDIVRRTLSSSRLAEQYAKHAWGLGLAAALLWLLHPLQTESVTYIYQRLESLMGMFYLATLWCFIRAIDARWRYLWYAASVVCCALGMATKEVMVTCPLAVLWYDRVFVASSWREMLRRRGAYYLFLAGTWCVLAAVVASAWDRYEKTGVLVQNFSALNYAWSQPGVILHYLWLTFWPDHLCLDYDWKIPLDVVKIVRTGLILAALLAAVVWCMVRRPALGFLGGCFFLILGPTSSFATVRDLAVEHRMYLPLAVPVVLVVLLGYEIWRNWTTQLFSKSAANSFVAQIAPLAVFLLVAVALGWRTFVRNEDYQSNLTIWRSTVQQRPLNLRARSSFSHALYQEANDKEGALKLLSETIRLAPTYAPAYYIRGNIHKNSQEHELAVKDFSRAIELLPKKLDARLGRGLSYMALGKFDSAIEDFTDAIELEPNWAAYYRLRAQCCLLRAQTTGAQDVRLAMSDAKRACELTGGRDAPSLEVLAAAYGEQGDFREALEWQSKALELIRGEDARRAAQARLDLYQAGKSSLRNQRSSDGASEWLESETGP